MAVELFPERAALIVIDYQARLRDAMPQTVYSQNMNHTLNLIKAANLLNLPVIVTEQYPKGLGKTVDELAIELPEPMEKTTFSAYRDPEIKNAIDGSERTQWIVVGMETHICVYQTARDLLAEGHEVWIPRDAVISRRKGDWTVGLDLLTHSGATVASAEVVLFDLLKAGRGDTFKAVSRLIR
jgi:nicotinamidase-related amidase